MTRVFCRPGVAVLAVLGALVSAGPAAAQGQTYQGLFAPRGEAARPQALAATFTLSQDYGDAIPADGFQWGSANQELRTPTGFFGLLSYVHDGPRVSVAATGQTSLRFYTKLRTSTTPRFSGDLKVTTKWDNYGYSSFSFYQSVAREPYFQTPLIGGSAAASSPFTIYRDDAVANDSAWVSHTRVEVSRRLSARNRLGVQGDARYTVFDLAGRSLGAFSVSPDFSRQLTRRVSLSANYSYERAQYQLSGVPAAFEVHGARFGIQFIKPTSKTRRTVFTFGGGAAYSPHLLGPQRATAFAKVDHQAQAWNVAADYRRGTEFVAGFIAPFHADTVTGTAGGFLTRRLQVSGAVGYSVGQVRADNYSMVQASGRVRVAFSRIAAVDAVYLYYQGDFGNTVAVVGLAPQSRRQAVRFDLTLLLPVVK